MNTSIKVGGKIKLLFSIDDVIVYIENLKESIDNY